MAKLKRRGGFTAADKRTAWVALGAFAVGMILYTADVFGIRTKALDPVASKLNKATSGGQA